MSTIQDTDLFLVERGGVSYKITGEDLKEDVGSGNPPSSDLTVSKGAITPTVNVEEGDTLTGSATVTDANGAFTETHVWEQDGIEAQRGTSATYVAEAGTVRYRKEVTDTVKTVIGAWSDAVTVIEVYDPTKPNATMSGLRFDSARQTILRGSQGSSVFTYSAWIKPTGTNMYLLTNEGAGANEDTYISWANGNFAVGNAGAQLIARGMPVNQWHHVVVSNDASGNLRGYFNGESIGSGILNSPKWTGERLVTGSNAAGSAFCDGYMSDVYFVDGEALEPTDFGKSFEGKWGPLDSSVVLENIKGQIKSPYSERPNYDQKWSDGYTNSNGHMSFDGNLTSTHSTAAGTFTFNPGLTGELELYFTNSSGSDGAGTAHGKIIDGDGNETLFETTDGYSPVRAIDMGSVTNITSIVTLDGHANLYGVKLNGQILVDGPADNSQNWSNYLSSNTSVVDGGNAFDGDTATNGQGFDGIFNAVPPAGFYDLVFEPPAPIPGPVSVWTNTGNVSSGYGGQYQVDTGSGYGALDGTYTQGAWNEIVPAGQDLVKFRIQSTTNGTSFAAMKYGSDDKILIDAGAQWEQSQVWSDYLVSDSGSYRPDNTPDKAFNGDGGATICESSTQGTNSTITFTPPAGTFSGAVNVEILSAQSTGVSVYITDGSGAETLMSNAGNTWTATVNGVQSFKVEGANGNAHADVRQVTIDGKILVDVGTLGDNGFYLPFDPNADNYIYSNYGTGTFNTDRGWDKAFNGLTSPGDESVNPVADSVAELIFPTAIPFKSLALWAGYGGSAPNNSFLINDVDVTGQIESAQARYPITIPGATELEKIKINKPATGFDGLILAVEVDGKLLVDHNAIGADASGNGNNFQDQNFTVSSPVDAEAHRYWAIRLEQNVNDHAPRSSEYNMYKSDGTRLIVSKSAEQNCADDGKILGVDNDLENLQTIDGSPAIVYDAGTPVSIVDAGGYNVYTTQGRSAIFSLNWSDNGTTWTNIYSAEVSSGPGLCGFYTMTGKIGGSTEDTVKDTPMRNYAVIDSARSTGSSSNGNLNSSTINTSNFGTLAIPATGKYYFESSPQSGILNIGIGAYQAGAANGYSNPNSCLYSSSGVKNVDTVVDQAFGPSYEAGDVIGVALDSDNAVVEFYKNGVSVGTINHTVSGLYPLISDGGGDLANSAVNFGQQPFVYTPPAGATGLYQDWVDYARSALGYATDRIAQLEAMHLMDSATIADLRTQIAGALSRLASIESDEVNDDAVDSALITLVGSLNSQVTAFTTRVAEAEAAIAAAEGRITTLES